MSDLGMIGINKNNVAFLVMYLQCMSLCQQLKQLKDESSADDVFMSIKPVA